MDYTALFIEETDPYFELVFLKLYCFEIYLINIRKTIQKKNSIYLLHFDVE